MQENAVNAYGSKNIKLHEQNYVVYDLELATCRVANYVMYDLELATRHGACNESHQSTCIL